MRFQELTLLRLLKPGAIVHLYEDIPALLDKPATILCHLLDDLMRHAILQDPVLRLESQILVAIVRHDVTEVHVSCCDDERGASVRLYIKILQHWVCLLSGNPSLLVGCQLGGFLNTLKKKGTRLSLISLLIDPLQKSSLKL